MSEETISINVRYTASNINESIRGTQRVLYLTNALRLSVVDLQQVMAGPTISNIMWTTIQLTRVWTHLYRIIKRTNDAQRSGVAGGIIGGMARGGAFGAAAGGQTTLAFGAGGVLSAQSPLAQAGMFASIVGLPLPVKLFLIGGTITAAMVGNDVRQRRIRREWIKRQREVAKSQGLEN